VSRLALDLERRVKEMKAEAAKKDRGGTKGRKANKEAGVADENGESNGNQLTGDTASGMTDVDLSQQQGEATGSNDAAGAGNSEEGTKQTMAKKTNGAKKVKAAKAPKAPKAAKAAKSAAPKSERKPREKKVASGKLKKVESTGNTYLTLEFEEGKIVLTPTGNREQNRDIAVKALRSLL
jgi:hypothetical protein